MRFLKNENILFRKFSPSVTKSKKEQLSAELAETVSAIGLLPRTVLEIKTKFKNVKMNAKNIFKWSKSYSCNWRRTRRITKSRGGGPRCSKTLSLLLG